jgi:hypothetical protein
VLGFALAIESIAAGFGDPALPRVVQRAWAAAQSHCQLIVDIIAGRRVVGEAGCEPGRLRNLAAGKPRAEPMWAKICAGLMVVPATQVLFRHSPL